MSTRGKWDERYRDREVADATACAGLRHFRHLLPTEGPALDLACGLGGNAIELARHGLTVDAWDISPIAVAKLGHHARNNGLAITPREVDITGVALPKGHYAAIVVSWFLDRGLAPAIIEALRPGGVLLYQTHTRERSAPGGPGNPDFLLEPNELLRLFAPLQLLAYLEQGEATTDDGLRDSALLIARR